MKAHKYWSIGAFITMIGTFYTGYKGLKSSHKYFALSSLLCMIMSICTKQACGFSERYPLFTEKGAVILGVSKDSVASHKRFEEKYGLAFTLLADPERKVIEAYDVWKEKKNYGKVSMGVVRTTYLIDENEIIIKANDKVKAADDPENMLKELT